MGACFSKKNTNSSSSAAPFHNPPKEIKSNVRLVKSNVEQETVKKEILVIKHRKSQDTERRSNNDDKVEAKKVNEITESCKPADCNNVSNRNEILVAAAPVRTSSCTKEELDAILIQCGRLSRSSSTGKAAGVSASSGSGENNGSVQRVRKYSGSKRSFDFDNGNNGDETRAMDGKKRDGFEENVERDDDNGVVARDGSNRHRQQQRQSRTVGSPSKGRRRTPSREREQGQQSGNRDSSSGSGGRRVSRSPGKRSESPISATSNGANPSAANANSTNGRPGKMVSVPATVSSLAMDKSNNAERNETISASAIKRTQVKRSAGGEVAAVSARTSASPRARSRSPARANVKILNDNGSSNQIPQQPASLSRSNSRKAEVSPFRRTPLGEINNNALVDQIPAQGLKAPSSILHQAPSQKLNASHTPSERTSEHGIDNKTCIGKGTVEKNANNASGTECFKPQSPTRTRSSRLSRDLDVDPELVSNPAPSSYTSLLLDDIHNFHQTSNPTFTLPACVSKANSIVEAVADLNSSTKPNLSSAFPDGKKGRPISYDNGGLETLTAGKKGLESKDHFMQSEVVADDDLMKPSFHRYVTVQRGSLGEDIEQQESSSGSNSFVGSQQHWVSSSSWEPDSADSTGRTSSRSNSREDDRCPLGGSQRQVISEPGHDSEEVLRRLSGKKRESNQQQSGIGRSRVGSKGQDRLSAAATAAAST